MKITTVGELLHWSYANLVMAHSAITAKAEKYGRTQFMIRSRLYSGLNKQTNEYWLPSGRRTLKDGIAASLLLLR
jgi:hypothetical protein